MSKDTQKYESPGQWAKMNEKFINVPIGESIKTQYVGFKVVPNKFDPDEETVQYLLKTPFGDKKLETASLTVARAMGTVEPGDTVIVSKEKYGEKGKWAVEIEKKEKKNAKE